jgi:hypothetical protein
MRLLGPAIVLALLVATLAYADNEKLAKHLHKLDPGGKVGGKSIVGTKPKQELHGVHGKPNFIIALGDDSTIHGASKNDQLGAIGDATKIVPSNHGHSLIVAGPHSKIVVPGKGHNLIFSHAKGATIILESPGDEVIAKGPHDRIVCKHHANHELIEVAKGEKVSKSCKGHHNTIEHLTSSSVSARSSAARAHASAEECIFPAGGTPPQVECVRTGDTRTLPRLWANEQVPEYFCPNGYFLVNQNYAPAGTHLINGVEVKGLGPVGVYIPFGVYGTPRLYIGNSSQNASATNWANNPFGPASYTVILHCTNDQTRSYGPDSP